MCFKIVQNDMFLFFFVFVFVFVVVVVVVVATIQEAVAPCILM